MSPFSQNYFTLYITYITDLHIEVATQQLKIISQPQNYTMKLKLR